MPLRPLGLGDIYDAAFRIIRHNPGATVGSAVLVAAVAMAVPVLVTALLASSYDLSTLVLEPDGSGLAMTGAEQLGTVVSLGSLALGAFLQSLGLVLVTGMVAHVTMAAAIGRRLTLGQAWGATRGQRWRLIALTFLLGLITAVVLGGYLALCFALVISLDGWSAFWFVLLSLPVLVVVLVAFWIRVYYLAVPALMLENLRVGQAMGRAVRLTSRAFWRTFGIALLTVIITQVGAAVLGAPVSLLSQAATSLGGVSPDSVLLLVLSNAGTSVLAAAFVAPFATAVTCLQYLDLRMRKEALDVELMTAAGLPRP